MLKTHIEYSNGMPCISVNGKLEAPLAYTTYFEECAEYFDFINNGYKIFFVNISFTDLPINNVTGFSPFLKGVFDNCEPDYSDFDDAVRKILTMCPDALIFPRINVAMPRWWVDTHPYDTVETPTGRREALSSDKFRIDGADLLKTMISHISSAEYSENIAGYQLCGGTTQEWIHHDLAGSFSGISLEKFNQWNMATYGEKSFSNITKEDLFKSGYNEAVSRYGDFCCREAALTAEHFARVTKECINAQQIVGVFYGYNAFVNDCLWGLSGLRHIIDSPYIDFFSSPCGYDDNRRLGIDWGDMLPTESLRLHNKLYFVECDIRTYLTKKMQESRPGKYPEIGFSLYDEKGNKTVWAGPDTLEGSLYAIRKAFCHQLTKGSGIWWFDMWGGWYHNNALMNELEIMKNTVSNSAKKDKNTYPNAEVVLFIDEKAYYNNPRGSELCHSVNRVRMNMGSSGIPFDMCMVEDANKVIDKYRFAIFTAPLPSEAGYKARELYKEKLIPYIEVSENKLYYTVEELQKILTSSGVHCYSDNAVIYCGEGFLGVHSPNEGKIQITLPGEYNIKPIFAREYEIKQNTTITVNMKKHETVLFELV